MAEAADFFLSTVCISGMQLIRSETRLQALGGARLVRQPIATAALVTVTGSILVGAVSHIAVLMRVVLPGSPRRRSADEAWALDARCGRLPHRLTAGAGVSFS
jgi:hypothetical protein